MSDLDINNFHDFFYFHHRLTIWSFLLSYNPVPFSNFSEMPSESVKSFVSISRFNGIYSKTFSGSTWVLNCCWAEEILFLTILVALVTCESPYFARALGHSKGPSHSFFHPSFLPIALLALLRRLTLGSQNVLPMPPRRAVWTRYGSFFSPLACIYLLKYVWKNEGKKPKGEGIGVTQGLFMRAISLCTAVVLQRLASISSERRIPDTSLASRVCIQSNKQKTKKT